MVAIGPSLVSGANLLIIWSKWVQKRKAVDCFHSLIFRTAKNTRLEAQPFVTEERMQIGSDLQLLEHRLERHWNASLQATLRGWVDTQRVHTVSWGWMGLDNSYDWQAKPIRLGRIMHQAETCPVTHDKVVKCTFCNTCSCEWSTEVLWMNSHILFASSTSAKPCVVFKHG